MTERPSRRVHRRLRPLLLAGAVALGWAVITSGSAQADDTATPIPVVSRADAGLPVLLVAPGSSGRSERHPVLPRASASARHVTAHLPHLPGMPSTTSAPATRTPSAPAPPRETPRAATKEARGATNQARGDHAPFQVTKDGPLEARKAAVRMPAPQLAVSTLRDTSALASRAASASLSTLTSSGLSSLAAPALQPVLAPVLAPVLPVLAPALGPRPETVLTAVLDPPAPSTATTPSPTPL
ncbi:MAG: hypothetical protein HOY76_18800, partial [Streptomyces sp.]|nr:hypothetical protein [Streptomyces sp.]